jgi:hypothetical protein
MLWRLQEQDAGENLHVKQEELTICRIGFYWTIFLLGSLLTDFIYFFAWILVCCFFKFE